MNQISFDKLKQNCIVEFCGNNTRVDGAQSCGNSPGNSAIAQLVELKRTGIFKNPRKLIVEIEDDCVKAIESVDIRNLNPLIELCPKSVPSWIKNGNYTINQEDNEGQKWVFVRSYLN